MPRSLVFPIFLCLLTLSACARTGLSRTVPGSLSRTIVNPLDRSCGTLKKPKEYCDANAEPTCLKLYGAAIRAAEIQCGYEQELDYVRRNGEHSDTPYLADRLKQIHLKYGEASDALLLELEEAYNATLEVTREQQLTYENLRNSLVDFSSRMSLTAPTTNRMPSSVYNRAIRRQKPNEERVPEIMNRLIIADPNAPKLNTFGLQPPKLRQ